MSEANEILKKSAKDVAGAFAVANDANAIYRKLRVDLAANGEEELLQKLKVARKNLTLQALGMAVGLVLSIPFYLLNRLMESVGVFGALFMVGVPVGAGAWALIGDRSSAAEFVAFILGAGMIIIPIAFIWALSGQENNDA